MNVMTQITQAAVLHCPENKILLLRLPDGAWHFPGGRLQARELWEDGLRREVKEETALTDFIIVDCLGVDNWVSETNKRPRYGVFFHCSVASTFVPTLSNEHRDYTWVGAGDSLECFEFHRPKIGGIIKKMLTLKNSQCEHFRTKNL